MKKRILSVVLAVITLVTSVFFTSFTVSAAEAGTFGKNLTWAFDSDKGILTVGGQGDLPQNVNYTKLPWYEFRDSIKSVVIEEGVTSVTNSAFFNCINLESLVLPSTLTNVYGNPFERCASLKAVYIPDIESWLNISFNVNPLTYAHNLYLSNGELVTEVNIPEGTKTIKMSAFSGASGITKITIPESVSSIELNAFENCSSLKSIEIPSGITSITGSVFEGCSSLESVILPDGLTSIGYEAFYNCSSLKNICIPTGVTEIGGRAFRGCISIENIEIPSGISEISSYAFYECKSLKNIVIPENVTVIGGSAFGSIPLLESVIVPDGVVSLGSNAFRDCTALSDIYLPDSITSIGRYAFDNTAYYNDRNNWDNGVLYISNQLIAADEEISSNCVVRDGTVSIADRAFYDCQALESLYIPGSVVAIETEAFLNCSNLESLYISEGLVTVGIQAFYRCTKLADITIPDSIRKIGRSAFASTEYYNDSKNWENHALYISNHLIEVSEDISEDCVVREGTIGIADSGISLSGMVYDDSDGGAWIRQDLIDVFLPDSLKYIGENGLATSKVENLSIGSGLEFIDFHGFWECIIDRVFYSGTEQQWAQITKDSGSTNHLEANSTFYYLGDGECPVINPEEFSEKEFDANGRVSIGLPVGSEKESSFSFTAWRDGDYYIYTNEQALNRIWIFDASGKVLDDYYADGTINKTVKMNCNAGETYYVVVNSFNVTTGYNGYGGKECIADIVINYNSGVAGDASGDGIFNAKDILVIKKVMASITGEDSISVLSADYNGDGKINSRDLVALKKLMVIN